MRNDEKLPPEWDWEPDQLTLAQMLRRDLFPRWEWIMRVQLDPIEAESHLLSQMLQQIQRNAESAANDTKEDHT